MKLVVELFLKSFNFKKDNVFNCFTLWDNTFLMFEFKKKYLDVR